MVDRLEEGHPTRKGVEELRRQAPWVLKNLIDSLSLLFKERTIVKEKAKKTVGKEKRAGGRRAGKKGVSGKKKTGV